MNQCQYPGCTKPAKKRWCVTHNCIVAKERATKRWREQNPNRGILHEPKGHDAYCNMILNANCDDSGKRRNDYAERPLGDTGVELFIHRGSRMPKSD